MQSISYKLGLKLQVKSVETESGNEDSWRWAEFARRMTKHASKSSNNTNLDNLFCQMLPERLVFQKSRESNKSQTLIGQRPQVLSHQQRLCIQSSLSVTRQSFGMLYHGYELCG